MSTHAPTFDQLKAPIDLATGEHHRIVLPPRPVRVRLVGILFETDKTFVLPSAMPGIRELKQLYDQHVGKTVLVSGHADRAGSAAHNLVLSVERAQSVAAFLQDQVDDWVSRYRAGHQKSTVWGTREDQYMLSAVEDGDGKPYYVGPVTGRSDGATRAAVGRFQADNGLGKTDMNAATRKLLVKKYLTTPDTSLPTGTTIVTHGCGETHPSVATKDSVALAENRRVELFFFEGAVTPPPVNPCPADGCDEYPQWVARSRQTIDINDEPEIVVLIVDELGLPLRKTPVQLVMPDGKTEQVQTDDQGIVRPRVAPGTTFDVIVADVHEAGPADSLTTPSGRHFSAGGSGPAEDVEDGS